MVRKVDEDTRFGVGNYDYLSDKIHNMEEALDWLCGVRDMHSYSVRYIRLEDIDGNENDTTTRLSADASSDEILNSIEGKEIGRVALVGEYMGAECRVSVYLKGYTIHLFLNTLDPFIHEKIVKGFQEI